MGEELTPRRMAKLYFKTSHGELAKSLATSIRDQNSLCNLIDQQHFAGPEDVESCSLVLIQKSAPKSKLIASCYEKVGSAGVQVVFFDDEGSVINDSQPENDPKPEKTVREPVAETTGTGTDSDTESDGFASVSEGDSEEYADPADD